MLFSVVVFIWMIKHRLRNKSSYVVLKGTDLYVVKN